MNKQLQDRIIHLRRQGVEFRQIARRLDITIEDVWQALDTWHNGMSIEPTKFPIQLLEDWDTTRLAILKKYGGEKYRDNK